MKPRSYPVLFRTILLCAGLFACTPGPAAPTAAIVETTPALSSPTPTTLPPTAASPTLTLTPSPAFTPTLSPTPQATLPAVDTSPQIDYHFRAILDYDTHSVEVEQDVEYTNQTGEVLPQLFLVVQPAVYPGAFRLGSVKGGDELIIHELVGSTLKLTLPTPLEPGAEAAFSLSYRLSLPDLETALEKGPIPFGYTTNQTNLVDWYPFIPPYKSPEGWVIHPGHEYGEHLTYEMAAFTVDLTVKGNWANLFVAASAPAEMQQKVYHYEMPEARSFAATVSHLYEETSQVVNGVTVSSFVFPIHKTAGQKVLQTTVEALQLYQELFGPYPHPLLTVVEADFLDGMEYDGLYFLSRGFYNLYAGTPGEYLVAIAAHETAHQWWYAEVGNDQALEPWLDEALCTYSEKLYYERYSPEGLQWWWEYRVAYYHPEGWVDTQIYPPKGKSQSYNQYRDAVYLRGAMFLEEVRKQAGDEAFFAFLKDYVRKFSGRNATRADFFALLSEHSPVDFSPLIAAFFETP